MHQAGGGAAREAGWRRGVVEGVRCGAAREEEQQQQRHGHRVPRARDRAGGRQELRGGHHRREARHVRLRHAYGLPRPPSLPRFRARPRPRRHRLHCLHLLRLHHPLPFGSYRGAAVLHRGLRVPRPSLYPTKALAPLMLEDYRKVMVDHRGEEEQYSYEDILRCMKMLYHWT